jgi:hypothetical protein
LRRSRRPRTSVYSASRQYRDGLGAASDRVAFGGSVTATDPLPASGCSDPGASVCLTDYQLTHELSSRGLVGGLDRQYFVFTPPGVGSCFDSSGSTCAYQVYCAYHSWFYAQGAPVLYAVHPFVAGVHSCDMGESPTGTSVDAVLNVVSHEHNEILTDPTGGGWYDATGDENGDKCAWTFGTTLGPSGALFNQTIGGASYLLQEEWSNQDSGCVQGSVNRLPVASFGFSGHPSAGHAVPFVAAAGGDPDGKIVSYAWSFGDGKTGAGRLPAHVFAKAGTYQVKLTVTDDEGGTGATTSAVLVAAAAVAPPPPPPAHNHKHHKKKHHKKKHRHRHPAPHG